MRSFAARVPRQVRAGGVRAEPLQPHLEGRDPPVLQRGPRRRPRPASTRFLGQRWRRRLTAPPCEGHWRAQPVEPLCTSGDGAHASPRLARERKPGPAAGLAVRTVLAGRPARTHRGPRRWQSLPAQHPHALIPARESPDLPVCSRPPRCRRFDAD